MAANSIEEIIRRAMEEGQFDNLPGKGRPLRLDDDSNSDPAWRAAHHVLKSSGYSLPWIETRREIEEALEATRSALGRSWTLRLRSVQAQRAGEQDRAADPGWVEAEWERAQAAFREQVDALNQRIRSYNLEVPASGFQRALIDAGREIERIRGEDESANYANEHA